MYSDPRPSQGPQNETELDLDAISERFGTRDRIIEGMKNTFETGDFDSTKMG
jgi:hypothetical protein